MNVFVDWVVEYTTRPYGVPAWKQALVFWGYLLGVPLVVAGVVAAILSYA